MLKYSICGSSCLKAPCESLLGFVPSEPQSQLRLAHGLAALDQVDSSISAIAVRLQKRLLASGRLLPIVLGMVRVVRVVRSHVRAQWRCFISFCDAMQVRACAYASHDKKQRNVCQSPEEAPWVSMPGM